jgi:abortive infection bacteriophage resistance protein
MVSLVIMPIPYTKPYLTIPAQIALLEQRGMLCSDRALAEAALRRYGYYRLSGYWYPFRQVDLAAGGVLDTFRDGTSIEQVVALAEFDKKLRILVLDALEQIEVALRVEVALVVGRHNPLAHRNAQFLHPSFANKIDPTTKQTAHQTWLLRHAEVTERSREEFVQSFKVKYSTELPIWIAIELWDFGLLSRFVGMLTVADQQKLSTRFGIADWRLLESWMRALGHTRNIAAHHSRLWNRALVNAGTPKIPAQGSMPDLDHLRADAFAQKRLYAVGTVIQHFVKYIDPSSTWASRLVDLLAAFPVAPKVAIDAAGFPQDWQKLPLWRA